MLISASFLWKRRQIILIFSLRDSALFEKESQDPIALTSASVQVNNLIFSYIATTSTVPSIQVNLKIDNFSATSTASLRSY